MHLRIRVRPALAGVAATPLTVAQAIATRNGSSQAVIGNVVGEPVATNAVNRTSFTAHYAIALADTAGETNTAKQRRNQVIHDSWQGNRNPFIDHPEWVASIWP